MSAANERADLASALTTKKRTRKVATTKKSTAKKTTTKKAATKKSTSKKATTRKTSSSSSSTARRKRNTTSAKRSTASLRTDLTKLTSENYTTGDFTRGATVLIQEEGVEILRDALMVMLASKTPLIGGMISDAALDTLLDKVADNYKKLTVADRKALRAVINWLRGDASSDEETKQGLVAMLSGQSTAAAPAKPTIEQSAALGPNDLKLKKLR